MPLNDQVPAFAAALTPSDTAPNQGAGLYIGGDGNVVLRPEGSATDVTFVGLKAGTILPVRFVAVRANLTTATNLVRLF
jgi:hypothetical protein